jgi:polar amino acid transport system substrate-binding protein
MESILDIKKQVAIVAMVLGVCLSTSVAHAADVRMVFGNTLAPYAIPETSSGLEVKIIHAALALHGHTLKPIFMPQARGQLALRNGVVDAAERGSPKILAENKFYPSEMRAINYQDVAITLKKNNLVINSINDLMGKKIVSFQGSTTYLGSAYAAAVKNNPDYTEAPFQTNQGLMLFHNRVQVVICDEIIFRYYNKNNQAGVNLTQDLVYHKILKPLITKSNNQIFASKQIRDDYDDGLKQLKNSGQYDKIIKDFNATELGNYVLLNKP